MERYKTWIEVDLDLVKQNFQALRRMAHGSKMMPIVKAGAYGHGVPFMSRFFEQCGADYFGVATLEEAQQLRRVGVSAPILILGYTSALCTKELMEYDITQTVYDPEQAAKMSELALAEGKRLKVHIKLDTGMTRLGIFCQRAEQIEEAMKQVEQIYQLQGLDCEGIFTHFAVADEKDNPFTMWQFSLFQEVCSQLRNRGITFRLQHCANSAAIANFPRTHLDMVRPGILLYGMSPSNDEVPSCLQCCTTFKSSVASVKEVPAGVTISYGRHYTTRHPMKVAVVPVGYADGYSRRLSDQAYMLIQGVQVPVLGSVCMDQCMADVSALPAVAPGDEVTVCGGRDPLALSFEQIGSLCGTLGYEVICQLSQRIPRVYLQGGKPVHTSVALIDD